MGRFGCIERHDELRQVREREEQLERQLQVVGVLPPHVGVGVLDGSGCRRLEYEQRAELDAASLGGVEHRLEELGLLERQGIRRYCR